MLLAAVTQNFPIDRLVVGLIGKTEPVVEERLLGSGAIVPLLRSTGLKRKPFSRQVLPAFKRRVRHPDPKRAMSARPFGILGDPLRAVFRPHHPFAVMLVDLATATDADEVRIFRMLGIDMIPHVFPTQLLQLAAVRARNVIALLRSLAIVCRDLASRLDHRRRDLEDLGVEEGLAATVRLDFRVAGLVHLPLGKVVLDLLSRRDHRQARRRVGAGRLDGTASVDALLVEHRVAGITAVLREQFGDVRHLAHQRHQLRLRPTPCVLLCRVDVEKIAGRHIKRAEREDVGTDGAADLRRLRQADDIARVLGRQRPKDLREERDQVFVVRPRMVRDALREHDVPLGPVEIVD
ncbi:hypothetical protein D9M68_665710 [compost metagenome]